MVLGVLARSNPMTFDVQRPGSQDRVAVGLGRDLPCWNEISPAPLASLVIAFGFLSLSWHANPRIAPWLKSRTVTMPSPFGFVRILAMLPCANSCPSFHCRGARPDNALMKKVTVPAGSFTIWVCSIRKNRMSSKVSMFRNGS